jgi:hypothetical protein
MVDETELAMSPKIGRPSKLVMRSTERDGKSVIITEHRMFQLGKIVIFPNVPTNGPASQGLGFTSLAYSAHVVLQSLSESHVGFVFPYPIKTIEDLFEEGRPVPFRVLKNRFIGGPVDSMKNRLSGTVDSMLMTFDDLVLLHLSL